ncbi:MAG: glycosyltransferase [Chitinophagaceae bacterium]|nr:glycosyltransferase [Chitinophagaceae bacterium]
MPLIIHWQDVVFYTFILVTIIQLSHYIYFFRRVAYFTPGVREKSQQHPVSVVICSRDDASNLAKNLPGVLVQHYPTTHEVIVVNHNSQDETKYLLEEFKKTFRHLQAVNLSHEAKGIPGKKYPLSIGIREAKYEVLLLTDSDCVPASEFWMNKMQEGYEEGIEIVLSYGAYNRRSGLLNKMIRFETFHSALQYLSFALAGKPYMGVGRNLSYKKDLFFKHKGFSSINHIPGGDDDLFISKVSTATNTAVVIDHDAITLSEPKTSFGDWIRQKNRHYTTGKYYKPLHKWLLGSYSASQFLFYPLFIASAVAFDWRFALIVFVIRMSVQAFYYYKAMGKLNEKDLFAWWWLMDMWMFFYYIIFVSALWKKPKKNWA